MDLTRPMCDRNSNWAFTVEEKIAMTKELIGFFANEMKCEIEFHSTPDKSKMKYWAEEHAQAGFRLEKLLKMQAPELV